MTEEDPIFRALGEVAREEERKDEPIAAVSPEALDRFTRAALGAVGGAQPPANVVRLPSRRSPIVIAAAAALALAAGVVLYVSSGTTTLPRYALVVNGEDHAVRGDDASPTSPRITFSTGAWVRLDLKPDGATAASVDAVAYLLREGDARAVTAAIRRGDSGAIRLEGARETLFGDATGAYELVVFVGRPGDLPRTPDAARSARTAAALRVVAVPIDLP